MKNYLLTFFIGVCFGAGACYISHPRVTIKETTTKRQIDDTVVKRTVLVKEPGGREVTTIDERLTRTERSDSVTKETAPALKSRATWNISVLAATSQKSHFGQLDYGVSATKELIGPVTVGAFGLTSGVVGASIGINF